jgi:hypothetical protein
MSCDHRRDDCGCQPLGTAATPIQPDNPPGKPSLQRRVGTSGAFATAMAAALTRHPKLDRFTSREPDDPSLALVDAWSAVLDVLAFYNERITNEGYLRTAVDPRSLVELAHSVGYQPGRGRASATFLAFTLEDAVGAPALVPVPTGTRVNSLPGPGEVPQTYETTGDLAARPAWNAMAARARVPQQITAGTTSVYVEGLRTDLSVGDAILVVGSEREASSADTHWAFRQLTSVQLLPDLDATRIGWVGGLGSPPASSGRSGVEQVPADRDLRVHVLRKKAAIFGAAAPDWRLISESVGGGRPDADGATARASRLVRKGGRHLQVERDDELLRGPDWPGFSVVAPGQPENTVDLDTTYAAASPGSWVVLTRSGVTTLYRVTATTEASRTDFTLNAKVTRLTLTGPTASHLFGAYVRETSAWLGSELLPLAAAPQALPVQGLEVELAARVPTLEASRSVIVRGPRPRLQVAEGVRGLDLSRTGAALVRLHPGDLLEVMGPVVDNGDGTLTWTTTQGRVTAARGALQRVAPPGDAEVRSEVAVIAGPTPGDPEVHTLHFNAPLTGCYDRDTVRILGNVAPATHGETKTQVLGSGNAAQTYQQFTLHQEPLTYVPARSGDGVLSTLEVRVDGRLWREVPQLFGTGPGDEVYQTRMDDDGTITVCFGDGRTGSRLATGGNNVTARFRIGTGLSGRVGADVLTLPMTRPLGLRSVTNPLPTGLAADLESPSAVRTNAPRTALTLGRVVSLSDVEDFARSVPGIGKAMATWLWDGRHRFVHLTVAGSGGQTLDDQARSDLRSVLLDAGDARLPLRVDAAEVVPVRVSISVVVDPAHEAKAVLDAVARSVSAALSIEARTLGQPLTNGDVILAAHAVAGVVAVNVTVPRTDVPSSAARMAGGIVRPAQLVVLAAGGLTVTEAAS